MLFSLFTQALVAAYALIALLNAYLVMQCWFCAAACGVYLCLNTSWGEVVFLYFTLATLQGLGGASVSRNRNPLNSMNC